MGDLRSKVKGYYWGRKKRGYKRLSDESQPKRGRWSWKIKLKIKLRLRRFNPSKLISKVHEAYVRMMTRMANYSPALSGGSLGCGYGGGAGMSEFGITPFKEYDEKMIIQLYNSLLMRQHAQLRLVEPSIPI